jgi:hypothetical protein
MINTRPIVVVGDKFAQFSQLDGAINVSKLAALFDGEAARGELPQRVVIGQGVSEGWLSYLKGRVQASGLPVEFVGEHQIAERATLGFSHKKQRRNVLITAPQQVDTNMYRMLLSVDDECEIMSDHTTGHHIQGMVLTEASRQAFLAVTERYLLPTDDRYYFVINKFNVNYHKFAFPVSISIDFEVVSTDHSRSDRLAAQAAIRFYQNGEMVCDADVEYTAILESRLADRERKTATSALEWVLNAHPPARPDAIGAA